MGDISSPYNSRNSFQRRAHKAIARCVDSQLVETASYETSRQQLVPFCCKYVDTSSHAIEYRSPWLIPETETATLSHFDRVR
jgi:hypothetical protein